MAPKCIESVQELLEAVMRRANLDFRVMCKLAAALLLGAVLLVPAGILAQDNKFRGLSGTVTDGQHEPLKGAVVEVQNEDDKSVVSFLADGQGHYEFRRLSAGTDYSFWATYRGHRSKTHALSKFNAKTVDVVAIEIKLN